MGPNMVGGQGGATPRISAGLSGMGLWFWRFEERVWKLSHSHGHRGWHDGTFGVHNGIKERLQVRLRVAPYVDNLVSGWRVVLARFHCAKVVCQPCVYAKTTLRKSQKVAWRTFTHEVPWKKKSRRSIKVTRIHDKLSV